MTTDEFIAEINRLLAPYNSSFSQPSGWMKEGLAFSCVHPPIEIPFPDDLTPAQRGVIISALRQRLVMK